MPIASKPFTLTCPSCGWDKTYVPTTDVILINLPEKCPKCQHHELKTEIRSSFSFAALLGEKC